MSHDSDARVRLSDTGRVGQLNRRFNNLAKETHMRRRTLILSLGVVATFAIANTAQAQAQYIPAVLSAIQTGYSAYQQAKSPEGLFAEEPTMSQAISQLETFMQGYRNQALVNDVTADLNLYSFIASNWQSNLTNGLESNFITQCINDLSQLQGDIQNGNMADAYALAPAFNLLTVTFVTATTAFGMINPANAYPAATLSSYFDSAMAVNYPLVGGLFVDYDIWCPSCSSGAHSALLWTQGGKTMWPKYAGTFFDDVDTGGLIWYYSCNLTLPGNVDSNLFQSCTAGPRFFGSNSPIASLPSAILSAAEAQAAQDRNAFVADPAVQAVISAMNGLIQTQHNVIVDWNGSIFPAVGHVLLAI